MKKVTFITSNPTKAEHLGKYLNFPVAHQKLDISEIQSLSVSEVAAAKAEAAYAILGTPVLVEDTALTFNALGQLPGTMVKWFLEEIGNEGLCKLLADFSDRSAKAETCFALCDETGIHLFLGTRLGSIAEAPRGTAGFGWDSIFVPESTEQTWAEMDTERQGQNSMRRLAIEKLQTFLDAHYK